MNDIFDIKRFGLLMKKDMSENWKKYTLQALLLWSALLIPFLIYSFGDYDQSIELTESRYMRLNRELLMIALFIFVVAFPLFIAQMMDVIKSKQGRIHYLTYPCSTLEKFITRYLIHTLVFFIAFVLAFYIADFMRVFIYSIPVDNQVVRHIDLSYLYGNDSQDNLFWSKMVVLTLSTGYLFLLSLYILGSTFWQNKSFVKTTVFIVLTTFLLVTIGYLVAMTVLDDTKSIDMPYWLENPEPIWYIVSGTLVAFALFLTVLAYFRFKEAELIEKW